MSNNNHNTDKSLEQWLWDAACSIRGVKEAPKYKDYILPLVFTKRLCDVFDDEINRIAKEVGGRAKAFEIVKHDKKLVRFYIPLEPANLDEPVWSVIRKLSDKIGEELTSYLLEIAKHNPKLINIIDRMDFNSTTHGQREISDDRLSALIEQISLKRLGLNDVEADIIGRSYEYLIRKFAEGSGQSAGEFYTPKEVGILMARVLEPIPGMEVYDPCCGSAGLLIKCQTVLDEKMKHQSTNVFTPLKMFGQEFTPDTWAMANMNMFIHDMEGEIEIGDTFKNPKFLTKNGLRTFDLVVANPMWNQPWYTEKDFENDEYNRLFAGSPPANNADWAWVQHIFASLTLTGKAAIVLDTNSLSRGSNTENGNREKLIRKNFVDNGYIFAVVLLPENLFYNTGAPGILMFLSKTRHKDVLLINASREFKKGKPKNYIHDEGIDKIVNTILSRTEIDGFSVLLDIQSLKDIDYDLSPQRHIPIDPDMGELEYDLLTTQLSSIENQLINKCQNRVSIVSTLVPNPSKNDELPDSWKSDKLSNIIVEEFSGDWGEETLIKDDYMKCAIIRGTDFPNIRFGKLTTCPYRFVKENRYLSKKPREGDLIVEISGGGKYQNTGRLIYFEKEFEDSEPPLLFSNFTKLLRVDSEKVLPLYVYYYWDFLYLLGRTARYEKQPTNIKNFKLQDFLQSETILYPISKDEQARIANVLRGMNEEITLANELSKILDGIKLTLSRELLEGLSLLPKEE